MKQIIKIAGICVVAFGLTACGGGSDGGSRVGGSDNAGGSGTPVAERTGKANYVGTFNAKIAPKNSTYLKEEGYVGGRFAGEIVAQADFDKDVIDVDLSARREEGVIKSYNAEFDDARIVGRDFWGKGRENIFIDGPEKSPISVGTTTKITGAFAGGGSQISGKTRSIEKDSIFSVETDFSANER